VSEQGASSAALQVSDALFSAVFIGLGGIVFAVALRHDVDPRWALGLIDAVMVALALLGARMAGRVVPAGPGDRPLDAPTPASVSGGDQED
jgi:hypothetical protein